MSPKRRIARSTSGRGVLEGQVEVGRDVRRGGQHVDEPGAHLGGLEVAHAHALDAVDLGELGSMVSRRRMSPRSLPYEVLFGDQHDLLDALLGQPAGLVQHVAGRETKEPRKDGMAQKEQRRSQPEASFTEATGEPSRRRRRGARGPETGATPSGRSEGAVAGKGHLPRSAARRG